MRKVLSYKSDFFFLSLLVLQFLLLSLVSGYIWFFMFNFENGLLFYFMFHIFILEPFITKVSKAKGYKSLDILYTWKNLMIIKHVITGLVYPYIFFIVFGILRYYALGRDTTPLWLNWDMEIFILILFFSFYIFLFLFKVKSYIFIIKSKYLQDTYLVTYSLHLYFLRNFYYRMLIEKINKYWWGFNYICGKNSAIYPSWYTSSYSYTDKNINIATFRKTLNYVYEKPQIFSLFICVFSFIEIIVNKNLYYSFFVLFYYFLLDLFVTGLYKIGRLDFIMDCCYSNYLNEKSWENPYFPHIFASFCEEPTLPYTYTRATVKEIPEEVLLRLNMLAELAEKPTIDSWEAHNILEFVVLKTNTNIFHRVKLKFYGTMGMSWEQHAVYARNQKRMVHTNTGISKLHPCTALFCITPIEKLALIREPYNWITFYTITQMIERVQLTEDVFPQYVSSLHPSILAQQPSSKTILALSEHNFLTTFDPFAKVGVGVSYHIDGPYTSKNQPRPDGRFNFHENWKYAYKGIIGTDQKAQAYGICSNQAICVGDKKYVQILNHCEKFLETTNALHAPQKHALQLLKHCSNDEIRKDTWASFLHLLPSHRAPPINTSHMIDDSNFTADTKELYFLALKKAQIISDILKKDFPHHKNDSWVTLANSVAELRAAKNTELIPSRQTLDLVLDFMSKT